MLGAAVFVVVASVVGVRASAAAADVLGCPPPGGAPAYQASLRALTGPGGADLAIHVVRAPESGCAIPQTLKKVQVKVFALGGKLSSTRNLDDVEAPGGSADLRLGSVARHQQVAVDVLVQSDDTTRTYVLRGETTTLLRPDLVVSETTVVNGTMNGPVVFATRAFDVRAHVSELNGDVGAAAVVTLRDGDTAFGSTTVDVEAGGSADAAFHDVALRSHFRLSC
jgi:hypothetical protein